MSAVTTNNVSCILRCVLRLLETSCVFNNFNLFKSNSKVLCGVFKILRHEREIQSDQPISVLRQHHVMKSPYNAICLCKHVCVYLLRSSGKKNLEPFNCLCQNNQSLYFFQSSKAVIDRLMFFYWFLRMIQMTVPTFRRRCLQNIGNITYHVKHKPK